MINPKVLEGEKEKKMMLFGGGGIYSEISDFHSPLSPVRHYDIEPNPLFLSFAEVEFDGLRGSDIELIVVVGP